MKYLVILLIGTILVGCGELSRPNLVTMDGVKLISENTTEGSEPSTYNQNSYQIGPKSRLLLRYESLESRAMEIDIQKKVYLQLAPSNESDLALARSALRLCPVTNPWMMLATWTHRHPYGGGSWTSNGGDFDQAGCVKALPVRQQDEENNSEEENNRPPELSDSRALLFDVTQWFKDYPRARGTTNGLILISSQPLKILGDRSGTYSPRMIFNEFPTSLSSRDS